MSQQPKAFTAFILYTDKQGNERDQPAVVVASTQADAARCLYETFSADPDCASIEAIAFEGAGTPIALDDIAELGAAIAAHNADANARAREADNVRPANATLH